MWGNIKEVLVDHEIEVDEFFEKMEMSEGDINALFEGKLPLTMEIADRLEKALGIPTYYWDSLEEDSNDKNNF